LPAPESEAGLGWLHALLARLENRLYRDIPQPSFVIRLQTPLQLALDRNRERDKPGKEGDDFVALRHHGFFVPDFSGAPVLELDTGTDPQMAIRAVRRLIWDALFDSGRRQPSALAEIPGPTFRDEIQDETVELQKS
jgi:hypothetical protein